MIAESAPEFFIGREQEFDLVSRLLNEAQGTCRVLLLNGLGGVGKTRLLLELSRQPARIAEALKRPVLVFPPADFDDVAIRLWPNLLKYMADQMEPALFTYFPLPLFRGLAHHSQVKHFNNLSR